MDIRPKCPLCGGPGVYKKTTRVYRKSGEPINTFITLFLGGPFLTLGLMVLLASVFEIKELEDILLSFIGSAVFIIPGGWAIRTYLGGSKAEIFQCETCRYEWSDLKKKLRELAQNLICPKCNRSVVSLQTRFIDRESGTVLPSEGKLWMNLLTAIIMPPYFIMILTQTFRLPIWIITAFIGAWAGYFLSTALLLIKYYLAEKSTCLGYKCDMCGNNWGLEDHNTRKNDTGISNSNETRNKMMVMDTKSGTGDKGVCPQCGEKIAVGYAKCFSCDFEFPEGGFLNEQD